MIWQKIWTKKGIHILFRGHLTVEEYIQINNEIYADSRIDNMKYIIKDFSGVESFDVHMQDDLVLPVAIDKGASRYLHPLKVALVATNRNTRRICQDYIDWSHRFRSRWTFRIFSSLEGAKRWVEADES